MRPNNNNTFVKRPKIRGCRGAVYLSEEFAIRPIEFWLIFKLCNVICILYVTQKLSNLFLWYFAVWVFWILSSYIKFRVKQFIFSATSYCLAIILIFQISQGSVATQLRWGGSLHQSYIERFLGNTSVEEFCKSVFICWRYETQCIYRDRQHSRCKTLQRYRLAP